MTTPNLPAFMTNYQGRGLADQIAASVGSGAPPTLSIEGGAFAITDAAGETERVGAHDPKIGLYVDVVIADVNQNKSKIYYGDKKYDPNNVSPPLCFSDNGIAPSIQSGVPQSPTCASCPNNVIGSAIGFKGTGVKACRDQIKMAVVLPQFPDEMFLLRVPPNSFKHLRTLTDWCKKSGAQLEQLVTRVWFEQGIVGTLMFGAISYVQDETLFKFVVKSVADKTTDALVGRNDIPRTQVLPAPSLSQMPGNALSSQQWAHEQARSEATRIPAPAPQGFTPGLPPAQPAVQQAATPAFAPSPNPSGMSTIPNTAAPAGGATTASPSEQPRRRRRTKEQIAADNAQQQAPQGQPAPMQAPFMANAPTQNPGPQTTQNPGPQTTAGNGTNFGIQPGAPPNPDLMNTLNNIFPQK